MIFFSVYKFLFESWIAERIHSNILKAKSHFGHAVTDLVASGQQGCIYQLMLIRGRNETEQPNKRKVSLKAGRGPVLLVCS